MRILDSILNVRGFVVACVIAAVLVAYAFFMPDTRIEYVRFLKPGVFIESHYEEQRLGRSMWVEDCNADSFPDLLVMEEVKLPWMQRWTRPTRWMMNEAIPISHKRLISGRDGSTIGNSAPAPEYDRQSYSLIGVDQRKGEAVDFVVGNGSDSLFFRTGESVDTSVTLPWSQPLMGPGIDPIRGIPIYFVAEDGHIDVQWYADDAHQEIEFDFSEYAFVTGRWLRTRLGPDAEWFLAISGAADDEELSLSSLYSWPNCERVASWLVEGEFFPSTLDRDSVTGEWMAYGSHRGPWVSDEEPDWSFVQIQQDGSMKSFKSPAQDDDSSIMIGFLLGDHSIYAGHVLVNRASTEESAAAIELWKLSESKPVWRQEFGESVGGESLENVTVQWMNDYSGDGFPEVSFISWYSRDDGQPEELGGKSAARAHFVLNGATGEFLADALD